MMEQNTTLVADILNKLPLYKFPAHSMMLMPEAKIQSTLVISTSVISNNRLSRTENLILVLT